MKNDHKEFYLKCECSDPIHFLEFSYYPDAEHPEHEPIYLYYCSDRNFGFWKRVWSALKFVFGTQKIIAGDIVVSKEKAKELAAFLNEVAE